MPDLTAAESPRASVWLAYLDGDVELDDLPIGGAPASALADLRLVFLERAAARLRLVKSADMALDDAVAGLVEAVEDIIGRRLLCPCVTLRPPERCAMSDAAEKNTMTDEIEFARGCMNHAGR
jgi:hypothetical protein